MILGDKPLISVVVLSQEIIMGNFVQVTEYDANMYAKIEYLDIYTFL
jgi:hypothetical protein